MGVVRQNTDGLDMASFSQLVPLPPTKVETLVATLAFELALELGFDNIVLEGDSKILIKVLQSSSSSLAQYGCIVYDIHFLASHFSTFNLSRVHWHCNEIAHSLTRGVTLFPLLSI